ncbi:DUF4190 domain-containing protein [Streptomyces sp. NPDC049916]|uniref:DUF4190 domain-containing protein n=1 Tax=Streptomyces sp. NPDC049916 TaxID=3155156 RepID=UPI0034293A1C
MSLPSYPDPSYSGPPSPGPDPYGDQGPAPRNGLALAALILGLLACVFFWTVAGGLLFGLLAVVFGIIGALRARQGRAPRKVMAIIGGVLGALGLIASVVLLVWVVNVVGSQEFKDYERCVDRSSGQAAEDRCTDDLIDELTN